MMPSELASEANVPPRRRASSTADIELDLDAASPKLSALSSSGSSLGARLGLATMARRTLGISLLLVTVFLWTLSNFLASVSYDI
jgi:solute carrier family 35 protein F5